MSPKKEKKKKRLKKERSYKDDGHHAIKRSVSYMPVEKPVGRKAWSLKSLLVKPARKPARPGIN